MVMAAARAGTSVVTAPDAFGLPRSIQFCVRGSPDRPGEPSDLERFVFAANT